MNKTVLFVLKKVIKNKKKNIKKSIAFVKLKVIEQYNYKEYVKMKNEWCQILV